MSTHSASGKRVLQVVYPKLLESVDCSKSVKVPAQFELGMSEFTDSAPRGKENTNIVSFSE